MDRTTEFISEKQEWKNYLKSAIFQASSVSFLLPSCFLISMCTVGGVCVSACEENHYQGR